MRLLVRIRRPQPQLARRNRFLQRYAEPGGRDVAVYVKVDGHMLGADMQRAHLHIVAVARARRGVAHPDLQRGRVRRYRMGAFVQQKHRGVIAQVLPHAGQMPRERYAHLRQMLLRANTRQHQQLWRIYRAAAQHDFAGVHAKYLAAALHLYADRVAALKQNPPRERVRPDGQVEPVARHSQVGQRRAHPDAVYAVERVVAHAGGFGVVHIFGERKARRLRCLQERARYRQELVRAVAPHGDGAVRAVKVVALKVKVVFHLAKVLQDIRKRPIAVALRRPVVVVFGDAAKEDLPVNRAAAARDLAARQPEGGPVRRRLRLIAPGVRVPVRLVIPGQDAVLDMIGQPLKVGVVGARLQQQHGAAGVLRQAARQRAARRTRAHYDHIVAHCRPPYRAYRLIAIADLPQIFAYIFGHSQFPPAHYTL